MPTHESLDFVPCASLSASLASIRTSPRCAMYARIGFFALRDASVLFVHCVFQRTKMSSTIVLVWLLGAAMMSQGPSAPTGCPMRLIVSPRGGNWADTAFPITADPGHQPHNVLTVQSSPGVIIQNKLRQVVPTFSVVIAAL